MVFIGRENIHIEYINEEREVTNLYSSATKTNHLISRWTTGHSDRIIYGANLRLGTSSGCGNRLTVSKSTQQEFVS